MEGEPVPDTRKTGGVSPLAKNAQAYLAAIIESSDDAIISKDLNGVIMSWNASAERIFGFSAQEAIGRHISIIIPEDRLDEENEIISKIRKGERVEHFQTVRRKKDASCLDISVTVSPIRSASGRIIGASKIARDITELKEIETALQTSEKKWRALTEAMPQLVWIDGPNGEWLYLSSQWADYTGETLEDLKSDRWLEVLHPDDRERTQEAWQEAVTTKAQYNIEYRIRRHDGQYRWFKTCGVPVRDETTAMTTWYGTCTEIQDQIDAKELAEAANAAKSEFLANMSHEIRTPMNAVVGLANLLEMSANKPERQKEFIHTLKLSAQQLMDLINDLLDVAKLESGQVQLEKTQFSFDEIINEVVSINAVNAREKGIELTVRSNDGTNLQLLGDPLRLRQILMNLVGNAVKFTNEGTVGIALQCDENREEGIAQVRIDISDTGIGIHPQKMETIFSKFSQADTSITRKYGGTGLGLSISKSLVELMGGKITVRSEAGKGSTFSIHLPFSLSTDSAPHKAFDTHAWSDLAAGWKPGHGHTRILLVEDFEANVLVATSMLSTFGYNVTVAHNGLEAMEILKRTRFDMILMDVQMPLMDGYKATRAIREHEERNRLPRIPIVGMTAHALQGDRERCVEAGMDDYLAKPFDPQKLAEIIAAQLAPLNLAVRLA